MEAKDEKAKGEVISGTEKEKKRKEQLEADAEKYFLAEQWYSMIAALVFFIICFGLGIPIWISTTSVQRETLPYGQIEASFSSKLQAKVDLELVVTQTSLKRHVLSEFGELAQEAFQTLNKQLSPNHFSVEFRGNMRVANSEELPAFAINGSLESMSKILPSSYGKVYSFYLVTTHDSKPYVTSTAQALVPVRNDGLKKSIETVVHLCKELFDTKPILDTFLATHGQVTQDQSIERRLKPSASYTAVITFMLPSSMVVDTASIFDQTDAYIANVKQTFDSLIGIKPIYQTLYYGNLNPEPSYNKEDGSYVYDASKLPDLINIVEAHIGASIESHPSMNFIVIVPDTKYQSLHIKRNDLNHTSSNAFFVPQWGGVSILPALASSVENSSSAYLPAEIKESLTAMIPMMMTLIGVPKLQVSALQESNEGLPTAWELNQWIALRTVENIRIAIHSLRSMSNLVQKIRNMVINERIAQKVEDALNAMAQSNKYLALGEPVAALKQSQIALDNAEQAFYDTSLLELLYFPEDQKYAIYVPLFLPVCLPLISTAFKAFKYFKSRRQKNATQKAVKTD